MGVSHFRNLYKAPETTSLPKIIKGARLFPRFVGPDEEKSLNNLASMNKLQDSLKLFKKYKIPGPYGWPIEFYLAFFETL